MAKKTTILLYGRSGSGKSTQIGELAEYVFKKLGKRTRLATADRGGLDPILPYVKLGLVEPVEMGDSDPWIFLNKVTRGYVRDKNEKWVQGNNSNIGCFAFESMRSMAEALMANLAVKAGQNVSIGGGSNISFDVAGDGEKLKISGNNMAHFGVVQNRMTEEIWQSQKLDAPYICWTSSVSKDEDQAAATKVLGPDVIGKALTAEVPRWFNVTYRIDIVPARDGKPESHILYLGSHVDVNAGNVAAVGNIRRPLDAPKLEVIKIEPASIARALDMMEKGQEEAVEVIRKRLNLHG